ncbi:hypothetical protein AAVH_41575 [Aphelenchoides avenae]|nr:hypothetical protein AAVH_41575 [Aphelenchus avenae]
MLQQPSPTKAVLAPARRALVTTSPTVSSKPSNGPVKLPSPLLKKSSSKHRSSTPNAIGTDLQMLTDKIDQQGGNDYEGQQEDARCE